MLLGTVSVSVSSVKWQKCRQLVSGLESAFTALEFWKTRQAICPKLAPVALDILAAPASQAYVEDYSQYVDCCVQGAEIV